MLLGVGLFVPAAGDVPAEEEDGGSAADVDADDGGVAVLGAGLEGVGAELDGGDVGVGVEEGVVWEKAYMAKSQIFLSLRSLKKMFRLPRLITPEN